MTLHLAWCSPLPPTPSGIADYAAELLPHLLERCAVTCYVENPDAVAPEIREFVRVKPLGAVLDATDELPVYHLGNHVGFHAQILRMAMRRPGVVVLHELVLHDLIQRVLLEAGQAEGFADWVRAAEPQATDARMRAMARCKIAPHDAPLCEPVVNAACSTVTFNAWARGALQRRCPDATSTAVPLYAADPPAHTGDIAELRTQYRIPPGAFVLGSFGHQTPNKRLDIALQAYCLEAQSFPDSVYVFAGPPSARLDVQEIAESLGIADRIRCFGYVSETMWWDLLRCTDLCVSLRGPTQGETSASTLKQLAAGKAVCVSADGPDMEYPEHVVARVPLDTGEVDALRGVMRRAAADASWRAALGEAARAYVSDTHSAANAAGQLVAACDEAQRVPPPTNRFDLDRALQETGGVSAALNRWMFRARLARSVGGSQGWRAVARASQRRLAGA